MWGLRHLNPPITDWQGRSVWLVGASTGIGEALARALHGLGAKVVVSARKADVLMALCEAHPGMTAKPLDVTDSAAVERAASEIERGLGLDVVVFCAGYYKPMRAANWSGEGCRQHWQVNVEGWWNVLDVVLPLLRGRGSGHLCAISSVAGYRALPKALAYGPTKAALSHLMQGLYIDLKAEGIGVSVVSPGFVSTPLTAQNDFKMPALISPDEAAREMIAGWSAGAFEIHFPKRFTWFMKALSYLPWRWYFSLMRRLDR